MSRARVAPLKKVCLPRLELLGSLLAARLLRFVRQAFRLPNNVAYSCWTDSRVALAWIQRDHKKWKQFVTNRVLEIQDITDPSRWFYCPGKQNPADLTTRGLYAEELMSSDLWLAGPPWLSRPKEEFCGPIECSQAVEEPPFDERVVMLTAKATSQPSPLLKVERWSSISKAIRVTGWFLRFIHNGRVCKNHRRSGDLSTDELPAAKQQIIHQCQWDMHHLELKPYDEVDP
ncbi:PREDICTED: uncharacterized protein LOC106813671 [Priapulus caudatus]|uniref:Uncharacterized protein LOC106813671 n=1 Tax=Priapulus caudatus TaxID=37621 RepID=A0ABM1EMD4_PRICU|nr:PREDICTED: uncharacterized protein LOC106813671 [Priapulus caudatus]